jgi:hypothetical protein
MQIIRRVDYPKTRWKNGAGASYEIASQREPGADFVWRLSIAAIEHEGHFSNYAGYQRFTALIAGEGFTLRADDGTVLEFVQPGQVHAYSGSVPCFCELHGGSCWDLNLIARQGVRAAMSVVHVTTAATLIGDPATGFVMVPLDVAVTVESGAARERLGPWDACLVAAGESATVAVDAAAGRGLLALASTACRT